MNKQQWRDGNANLWYTALKLFCRKKRPKSELKVKELHSNVVIGKAGKSEARSKLTAWDQDMITQMEHEQKAIARGRKLLREEQCAPGPQIDMSALSGRGHDFYDKLRMKKDKPIFPFKPIEQDDKWSEAMSDAKEQHENMMEELRRRATEFADDALKYRALQKKHSDLADQVATVERARIAIDQERQQHELAMLRKYLGCKCEALAGPQKGYYVDSLVKMMDSLVPEQKESAE